MQRLAFAAALAAFSAPAAFALTTLETDGTGRMIAPVTINGEGPYRLILDTGANRTVLAPHVAADLGLSAEAGEAPLLGVAGVGQAQTVQIDHLDAGAFERRDVRAAIVSGYMLADADGIIGMDGLQRKRLLIHIANGAFEVSEGGAEPPARFVRVPGRLRFGTLLEVPIEVNGVPARAFIDTGADLTLANDALLRRLGAPRDTSDADVVGAGAEESTYRVRLSRVKLGPLNIEQLDAYRAAVPHAREPNGEEMPALIIGMDVWGKMHELAIDFARAELQVSMAAQTSGRARRAG